MKANELRIGNWVKHPNSEWDEKLDIENFNVENIEYYTPIPITEEWLVKFGFVKVDWFFLETKFTTIYISPLTGRCSIGANEEYDLPYKIQHVHQLQNLYFALTGEELKPAR